MKFNFKGGTRILPYLVVLLLAAFVAGTLFLPSFFKEKEKVRVKGVRVEKKKEGKEGKEEEPFEVFQEESQEESTSTGESTGFRRGRVVSTTPSLSVPAPPAEPLDNVSPKVTCLTEKEKNQEAKQDEPKNIEAEVTDNVGVLEVFLYYRNVQDIAFVSQKMQFLGQNKYVGIIGKEDVNRCYNERNYIEYYIEAKDTSGNVSREPKNAPASTYKITPEGWIIPSP